ncbi:MAG: crotonase/enoyl-CoA hydratase family protein [Burkholderiales bacterium]
MDMYIPHALLRVPQPFPLARQGSEFTFSPQLKARFDGETHSMWCRWRPDPRPCFNPRLLADLRLYCDFISQSEGSMQHENETLPIEYTVISSEVPKVFNLGGDLDLFKQLIAERDRNGLLLYGRACIDVLYQNYRAYDLPLTTISLVQGECLGGGFECALSSDIIIAEKSSRFGFPEILFNLFPGMGAYSFLNRRIGQRAAEELLTSGKIYSADEMLAKGVVDIVREDGEGEAEIAALVKRRARSHNGMAGIAAARRRVQRLEFSELLDIVELWVDSALRLTPRDLKLMQRLVSRQNDIRGSQLLH